jgi:hypothetical protein
MENWVINWFEILWFYNFSIEFPKRVTFHMSSCKFYWNCGKHFGLHPIAISRDAAVPSYRISRIFSRGFLFIKHYCSAGRETRVKSNQYGFTMIIDEWWEFEFRKKKSLTCLLSDNVMRRRESWWNSNFTHNNAIVSNISFEILYYDRCLSHIFLPRH